MTTKLTRLASLARHAPTHGSRPSWQGRAGQTRADKGRAWQSRAKQNRAGQTRADQSKAEQGRSSRNAEKRSKKQQKSSREAAENNRKTTEKTPNIALLVKILCNFCPDSVQISSRFCPDVVQICEDFVQILSRLSWVPFCCLFGVQVLQTFVKKHCFYM